MTISSSFIFFPFSRYQCFHFSLSDNTASFLPSLFKPENNMEDSTEMILAPKVNIAVFPRSLADEMTASCFIPLTEIKLEVHYP